MGWLRYLLLLSLAYAHSYISRLRFPEQIMFLSPYDFMKAELLPTVQPSEEDMQAMMRADLFEGDIQGVDRNNYILLDSYSSDPFSYRYHSALNLGTYPDKLWPGGRVPYMLSDKLSTFNRTFANNIYPSENERVSVAQAFEEYRTKTCVRFVPKEKDDKDYIMVIRNANEGCSSYVGRAGGNQTLSLEVGKCFKKGIIAHELMHALGFFHEHSRPDRDKFVDIIETNIKPGMLRNFEKYPQKIINTMSMPYDYESVMHYHKLAFSKNGQATILPKDRAAHIGQRIELSKVDAEKVSNLYKCNEIPETTSTPTTTTSTTTTTTTTTVPTTTVTVPIEFTEESNITANETTVEPTTTTVTTTTSTESTTSATRAPITTQIPCEDLNDHCELWAEIGHCSWSEKYMGYYCRKSCRICSTGPKPTPAATKCNDQNLFCGYWSRIGECQADSRFMSLFCKRSCDLC